MSSTLLWFLIGLALVILLTGIFYVVHRRLHEDHESLPPDVLPTDWESVMPKASKKAAEKKKEDPREALRRVGKRRPPGEGIWGRITSLFRS